MELNQIKIIRYEGNLHYLSASHFGQSIYNESHFDPYLIKFKQIKYQNKLQMINLQLGYKIQSKTDLINYSNESRINCNSLNLEYGKHFLKICLF